MQMFSCNFVFLLVYKLKIKFSRTNYAMNNPIDGALRAAGSMDIGFM